jgi:hypothetical protein
VNSLSRILLVLGASAAWASSYAQSAVGTWTGHIDVSAVKAADANQQKMMDSMKKMFASTVLKLSLKADKTYSIVITGMGPSAKPTTETGKWSQSGRTVTVSDKSGKPQAMNLSANGKTMVMTPPSGKGGPAGMKIVFTKG